MATFRRHDVTSHRNSIAFSQFTNLPFFGSTWVARESAPADLPFFVDIDREGGSGDSILGFTVQAGRWVVIVDRPCVHGHGSNGAPLWNQTAWVTLAAPLVALVGIAACFLASPCRHALARLQSPRRAAAEGPAA